ncbi:MAG: patatin-like phospholipase family protein, partial [Candidatus Obscuribacterales bacterium]|nr:patatin-like phospholipase family protein [Candidatus Obscuribacterales bacterium]
IDVNIFRIPKRTCSASKSETGIKVAVAAMLCILTNNSVFAEGTSEQSIAPKSNNVKVGLALAGGGARGCAHIGVLRVLKEEGVPIDCISGTSIGAIVGGLYSSGTSLEQIEKYMCSKELMRAYQTVPLPVRLALVPIFFVPHLFGWHPYDGLYRGNRFAKFIRNSAASENKNIESFKIPFSAVAANLLDGKAYPIDKGDIGKAVQASSAIPFLRRPVEIGDKLFVDGGIVENLPTDKARELGAEFVIAVDIDDDLKIHSKEDFRKIGSVARRAVNMQLSALDSFQRPKADFVIHPDVTGIELLDGSPKDALKAIKAGEDAARKAMPELKRKLQEHSVSLAGKIIEKQNKESE